MRAERVTPINELTLTLDGRIAVSYSIPARFEGETVL
jgi:hypothetical protein